MFNLFGWLRRQVSQAVIDGVADAVETLASNDVHGTVAVALPESLARRLTALPAAEARQEAEGDGGALVPTPSRNGRKVK
jgi:hypothetical protein